MKRTQKDKMNNIKSLMIFVIIEIFFLYRNIDGNLEVFFMFWGFVSLSLLLFNVVKVRSDGAIPGGVGTPTNHGSDGNFLAMAFYEKLFHKDNKDTSFGGVMDSINIAYLILLVVNVIGYVIVMPK